MLRFAIVLLLLVLGARAHAQTIDLETLTRTQFMALSEELKAKLPALKVYGRIGLAEYPVPPGRSDPLALGVKTFDIEYALFLMGIHHEPTMARESRELTASIRKFQKLIGVPDTGVLLWGEMIELERRGDLLGVLKIDPTPQGMRVFVDEETAEADGVWNDALAKVPSPVDRISIRCSKTRKECVGTTSAFRRDAGSAIARMDVSWTTWRVTSWQNNEVEAVADLSSCEVSTITINDRVATLAIDVKEGVSCPTSLRRGAGLTDGKKNSSWFIGDFIDDRRKVMYPDFLRPAFRNLRVPEPW